MRCSCPSPPQPNGTNRLRKPQLLIARNVLADAPDAAVVEGCQSCSLCYRGLLSDVLINNCVLAVVLCTLALSCAVHSEEPMTRRLFFLPYGLCCVGVQLCVSALAGAEGFSLVWCALLGLLTHAHLAFLVHGGEAAEPRVPSAVVAAAAAAVGGAALAYYALREHVLSTVAHLVAGGVGFGSSAVERVCSTQTFIAVGTLGVVILTALCICHWLRHARAQLAANSDGTLSDSSTRHDGFAAVKSQEGELPCRAVTGDEPSGPQEQLSSSTMLGQDLGLQIRTPQLQLVRSDSGLDCRGSHQVLQETPRLPRLLPMIARSVIINKCNRLPAGTRPLPVQKPQHATLPGMRTAVRV